MFSRSAELDNHRQEHRVSFCFVGCIYRTTMLERLQEMRVLRTIPRNIQTQGSSVLRHTSNLYQYNKEQELTTILY